MLEPVLPPDVPRPLDLELLAWAAGFFDGEGSTFARTDVRRSGYLQLDVSVPQAGRDGTPEVLLKFQRAMLGVGVIYPQHRDDLFKWAAGGRVTGELALALLWPWLGAVKRAQASKALDRTAEQYRSGRHRQGRAHYRPTLVPHAGIVGAGAERVDLAWAGGFLDAEGYFGIPSARRRLDGTVGFPIRASASQHGAPHVPAEVLVRLRDVLGGAIERHGEIDDFKWVMGGTVNVARLVERVRPWLGPVKIAQAEAALAKAASTRLRGTEERCSRGHAHDHVYIRSDGTIHRVCNTCERLRRRKKRIAMGCMPRLLRDPSRDPTRIYAN